MYARASLEEESYIPKNLVVTNYVAGLKLNHTYSIFLDSSEKYVFNVYSTCLCFILAW